MPAELVPQPCEVCLKLTTNRCSECAKASFDLYFCSRDCQKLAWKLHKTVCGPGKAHPFFVEPLTDEEIADARVRAHVTVMAYSKGKTIFSTLGVDLAKVSGRSLEYVLQHLGGPLADASQLPKKALLVSMVRRSRFAQAGQRQRFDDDASMFLLMFTGAVLAQYCRRKLPDDIIAAPWWSKLHHGLLILAILTRKIKQNKKSPLAPIYRRKLIEVMRWVRTGMDMNDSEITESLEDVTLEFFGAETLPPGPL